MAKDISVNPVVANQPSRELLEATQVVIAGLTI
jgi:hypothetical protein